MAAAICSLVNEMSGELLRPFCRVFLLWLKDARIKATKETCYTKKDSVFLTQPADIWEPEFKTSCKDKTGFFEVREDCFSDAEKLNHYIHEIFSFLK